MIDHALVALTFVAALGSGLIAGVFYAFSTFVMRALARIPTAAGIAAMQSINVVVINPLFLGAFLGTAAMSAAVIVGAAVRWGTPSAGLLLLGGTLYLVGTFGVTIACNVPLNNELAAVAPDDPDAGRRWAGYVGRWTMWNHVRTAAALAATAVLVLWLRR